MSIMNYTGPTRMYEQLFMTAAISKYRFPGPESDDQYMVEDLFELQDDDLDAVYQKLNSENHAHDSKDSLRQPLSPDCDLVNKIHIVQEIYHYNQWKRKSEEQEQKSEKLLQWAKMARDLSKNGVTRAQIDTIINSGGRSNPFDMDIPIQALLSDHWAANAAYPAYSTLSRISTPILSESTTINDDVSDDNDDDTEF